MIKINTEEKYTIIMKKITINYGERIITDILHIIHRIFTRIERRKYILRYRCGPIFVVRESSRHVPTPQDG